MRHAHRTPLHYLGAPLVIGHRADGSPIWSIAGGSDDDGQGDAPDTDDGTDDDASADADDAADDADDGQDDDKPLGEAGEKALKALKEERRDLKRQLRELRASKPKDDSKDDPDQLTADQLREQVREELRAESSKDRALDKLETKAARKLHNPEDARHFLADRADDFLDDEGNPDVEAINEALDELLEERPYLAAQGDQRFKGDADAGTRNGSGKGSQLTREDIKRMSPEAVEKAREEGRLDRVLGKSS